MENLLTQDTKRLRVYGVDFGEFQEETKAFNETIGKMTFKLPFRQIKYPLSRVPLQEIS